MAHNDNRAGVQYSGEDEFDNWNPTEEDVSNLSLMNNCSPMPNNYDNMGGVDMFRTEPLHSAETSEDYGNFDVNLNLDPLEVSVLPEHLENVEDVPVLPSAYDTGGNYQGNNDVFDQLNDIEFYDQNDLENMPNDGMYEADAVDNQESDAAYDNQAGDYVYNEQQDGAYQEYDNAYEQSPLMWYDLPENNVYDQQQDGSVYDQQQNSAVYDQQQNGAMYDQLQNGAMYDQQLNDAVYDQQQNHGLYNQPNALVYVPQQNTAMYNQQYVPVNNQQQNGYVYEQPNSDVYDNQGYPVNQEQTDGTDNDVLPDYEYYGLPDASFDLENDSVFNSTLDVGNDPQQMRMNDALQKRVNDALLYRKMRLENKNLDNHGYPIYQDQMDGTDYGVQSDYDYNAVFDAENDAVFNSTIDVGDDPQQMRLQNAPKCVREAQDDGDVALVQRTTTSEEAFFNRTVQSAGHKPRGEDTIGASTNDAPNVSIQTTPVRIRLNFPRRPIAETLDFVPEDEPTEYELNETLRMVDDAADAPLPAAPSPASTRKPKPPFEGYVGNQIKYNYIPFPKDQFALRQAGKLVKRKSEPPNLARGLRQDVGALDLSTIERGSNIQPYVDKNPNTKDLLLSGMFAPYTPVRNTTGVRLPLRPRHEYPAMHTSFRYGSHPRNMEAHKYLQNEYAKPPPVPPLPPRETRNVTFDPMLQVPREELIPGTRNDDAERSIIAALSQSIEGLGYENNPYGGVDLPGFLKAYENHIAKNASNPEDIDQEIFDAYEKKIIGLRNQSVDNTNEPSFDSFKLDNGEDNNGGDNEEFDNFANRRMIDHHQKRNGSFDIEEYEDFGDNESSYDKQSLYGSFDIHKRNKSNDSDGGNQSNIPYDKIVNDLNFTTNFDNNVNFSSNFVNNFESSNVSPASDSDNESDDGFDLEKSILEEIDDVDIALKLGAPSQNIIGERPNIASAPTALGPVDELRRLPGLTTNSAALMMHLEEHGLPMTASPEQLYHTLFPESQKERDNAASQISSIIDGATRFQKFITPISSSGRKGPGERDRFIDEQTMARLAEDRTMPYAERASDKPKTNTQKTALNDDGTVKTLLEFLVGATQKPTSSSGMPRNFQNSGIDTSLYWLSSENETNILNMGMCPPPSDPSITTAGMDPCSTNKATEHVSRKESLRRNYVQLRGSNEMSFFPGYFVALPNQKTSIQRTEFKTEMLHRAWHALKPDVFDEQDQIAIEITTF